MENKKGKILAIDDNEDILISLTLFLKNHFDRIDTVKNTSKGMKLIKNGDYDVILLDMNFTKDAISGQEGFDCLQKILKIDPEAVVVFMTAYGDTEKAVQAIKLGAIDFIIKPWQNEKLLATITAAIHLRRSRLEIKGLKNKQKELSLILDQPFYDFVGFSTQMREVFKTIKKVAPTDANVLILGENGTGKELVARALHRYSERNGEVFISVDLGSISENLFESELFGHEKGAFTDAYKDKPGRCELASGGTLFLDEIGNLNFPLQAKLLSVIEKKEVCRVGANNPIPIDIRLISATNSNLDDLLLSNSFRQDLLYRINTIEIHLPPLRERKGDIKHLANHFLNIYSKKYKKSGLSISEPAMEKLNNYHWPGNVRELQHAIERAIIFCEHESIQPADFALKLHFAKSGEFLIETNNLQEIENKIVSSVLLKYHNNISHAARELGITRASLYRRKEKYGL